MPEDRFYNWYDRTYTTEHKQAYVGYTVRANGTQRADYTRMVNQHRSPFGFRVTHPNDPSIMFTDTLDPYTTEQYPAPPA
jgi:hypothetical protein